MSGVTCDIKQDGRFQDTLPRILQGIITFVNYKHLALEKYLSFLYLR